jgi:hypothetical protein
MTRQTILSLSARSVRATLLLATVLGSMAACATLQQIAALRRVDFALRGVRNGELAGVQDNRLH